MSAAIDCCAPCQPVVTNVPGVQGDPGQDGADGADGISAFTLLTSTATVPALAGDAVAFTVAENSWMAEDQVLFLSDGTDRMTVRTTGFTGTTAVSAVWIDAPNDSAPGAIVDIGGKVSPGGEPGEFTDPLPVANGGTGASTVQTALTNLGLGFTPLTVYAAGTAYQLTNTQALLNFGTTDPSLTLTSPGVYLLLARARIDYNGATFADEETVTLKLRRTNNTAADVTNSSNSFLTQIITTLSHTAMIVDFPPVVYTTTNSDDVIQMWGACVDLPGAGSIDAVEASIVAVKIFNQTL